VRSLSPAYDAAVEAIDVANGADPTRVVVRGSGEPLALVHGRLAVEWMLQLHPDAHETWLLAARAHHLRRWELPRTMYPEGKAGYLRWKRDQRQRHGREVALLLIDAGYEPADVERVQALVRRDHLATDVGAQAVEDVACLVFIETQLAEVAGKLEHEHLVDVIRKTAKKMSPEALAAVATIPLGDHERALLHDALG